MKSYNFLWNNFISYENIYKAYKKARKVNPNSLKVLKFEFNLERNLLNIQKELRENRYDVSKYFVFTIYEPKKRLIKSLPFKDRIIQHALINIIEPIFEKSFIFDSFACRKEKGIHQGLKRVKRVVSENKYKYFVKADIKKYFFSVDKEILKQIISKKIKDRKILNLVFKIINSDNSHLDKNKGIPIGNLSSQLFSNIYLDRLDKFVKNKLGIKKYFRYVDDFLIFSNSKRYLNQIIYKIRIFLKKELKLKLPFKKTNIYLVRKGVDFVGYRIYLDFIKIRKTSLTKFIKETKKNIFLFNRKRLFLEKLEASINSYLGYFFHSNCFFVLDYIFSFYFLEYRYLFEKMYF